MSNATLGLRIESEEAEVAEKRLDNLSASAAKAERATDSLANGSSRADGAIAKMIASIEVGVRDLVAMGQANMILAQHSMQAATATNALAGATDKLAADTKGAGAAVQQLDSHMDAYRASLSATAAAAASANDNIAKVPAIHAQAIGSSKAMTQATLNLTRQFADVGVTAAMGMSPLMILIQQGPQIADAFQMAATQGLKASDVLKGFAVQMGLLRVVQTGAIAAQTAETAATVAGAAADVAATGAATGLAAAHGAQAAAATAAGVATTYALGPVLLILAPIVAVIGAVTAGFALFHRELSKDYPKNITDGLNLTDAQLKRVKGTTVTFGDTLQATFNVAGKAIMDGPIGAALKWMADNFSAVLNWIVKAVIDAVANVIGHWMTAVQMIGKHWRQLPALIAVATEAAVNLVIDGVNRLIEGAAGGLNRIIKATNDVTGSKFAEISVKGFDHIKLASGAAVDAIREDWTATMASNVASVRASMTSISDAISTEALRLARKDALKEAGDAAKEAAAAGNQRAQSLIRELDAMKATTDANYELARAYEESGGAAAEAEAKAEAVGKAIRKQGDIALFVAATLALNASKEAVTGAKKLREIEDQLEATARLNAQVRAGTITSDQANARLQEEADLRPLIAAAATEEGDRKAYLLSLVEKLTGQQAALNAELTKSQLLAEAASNRDQIAMIQKETELLGASNLVRAVTLAQLAKEQELRSKGISSDSTEWADAVRGAVELATAQVTATEAAESHNAALNEQLDLLQGIEDRARDAGQGMADAFGPVGKALGDLTSMVAGYATAQEDAARRTADAIKAAGSDQVAIDRITRQSSEESARAKIDHYGDLLSASKGFFDKESAAYRTLQAAEQVYRAYQFAMSIKAMFMKTAETTATVAGAAIETAAVVGAEGVKTTATLAGSAARIPAKIAEGAASMFAALGPLGFVAVGAMMAVLAAIGLGGMGGGGGGSIPVMPTTNNGTGTVLGDGNDPSESLKKSLEMSERYWNKDLDYSNKMVAALRSIQSNIGNLTTAIAKEMNVGGGLDASGLNKGPTTSGGLFGIGATTRSSNVVGSGINLNGGNLGSIIANGVSGALYQIVQNTKTKSGFFGIGGGTTTWNTEQTTGIDSSLSKEVSRVLASLRDGVLTAAGQLGVTGAAAALDAFQVNLGRISFDGLSSAEINQKLNDVFSAVGDQMAQAILPGLSAFQKAGEGLFETLARLVTEYKAVDDVMAMLGKTFGPVGLGSIEARARLVELAGGLEAFTESADFFAENFLTEAQRIAPIQAAVSAELARLGIASDISRSQFADLVLGLDVSTESGAAMYAALMALAPALAKVIDYTEETTGVVGNATDLARQRRELELRLLEAQGRISEALAGRRADELAAMDASLRPMQEAIWAAQDMANAAEQLATSEKEAAALMGQLARQRRSMEIELLDAQGKASEALAARRQDELDALDATLRPLQLAIWAAEDLATAQQSLAAAQKEAADAAEREAERVAKIAEQRTNLEIQLMEATGDAAGALTARRALELAAMDESLRPLQAMIYAALDLAAANEAAAAAAKAEAQAAEEARQARLQRVEDARGALSQAYEREAGTLQGVIDKFGSFGESLRAFRDTLGQADDSTATYASRRAEFLRTANLARLGDEAALGNLQGVSQDFLASSLQNASSNVAYQRDIAAVRAAVDAAIGTADRGKTNAERQLAALDASVSGLIEVNESVLSVRDAIRDLMLVMGGRAPIGPTTGPTAPTSAYVPDFSPVPLSTTGANPIGLADPADLVAEVRGLRQEVASLRAEQTAGHTAIANNTGRTARTLDRWDGDGLPEERDAA